jgi:hypothetical protein
MNSNALLPLFLGHIYLHELHRAIISMDAQLVE